MLVGFFRLNFENRNARNSNTVENIKPAADNETVFA